MIPPATHCSAHYGLAGGTPALCAYLGHAAAGGASLRRVFDLSALTARQAGRSEWNVKKGGNAFGVPVLAFQVVVCRTDRGTIYLCVPSTDVGLVLTALRQRLADGLRTRGT